jgi:hypothetical protein
MASESVTIDLTGYKDKTGSRVPEGRYHVVVDDCEKDKSGQGNDMINVYLRVVGGEYADASLMDRLVLTEKSLFRVVGFMQALGIPTPKKKLNVDIAKWRGRHLWVDVSDGDPYMGRVRSECRGYERYVEKKAGPSATDALEGLDEFGPSSANGIGPDATEPDVTAGLDTSVSADGVQDEVDLDQLKL